MAKFIPSSHVKRATRGTLWRPGQEALERFDLPRIRVQKWEPSMGKPKVGPAGISAGDAGYSYNQL